MVNRGRGKEIRKSSDDRFNWIWSDYRRMKIRAVLKMGYFLCLMMLGMSMEWIYKGRLISTTKGRKIKEW